MDYFCTRKLILYGKNAWCLNIGCKIFAEMKTGTKNNSNEQSQKYYIAKHTGALGVSF